MAEALAKVAAALVEVWDTPVLSQRIVDELRSLFETRGVMFCRVDPETDSLRAVAVSGDVGPEYDTHVVFAAGMGTPGLAVTEPRPVVFTDVLADARVQLTPEMRDLISRAPFRAVLTAPVILHNRIIGTLCLLDRKGRLFTDDEAWFLQAIAHQAALALESASLYEKAERLRTEAVVANQAKDVFIATLSHELRTLLNGALGWARVLRTGQPDKVATDHALEAIERSCVLQTRLIEDLLDISRIITGKLTLSIERVELSTIAAQSIEQLQRAAEEKGVILTVRIDPNIGSVEGDPLRLHQVVTNLVSNGIKFTPRGGRVEVTLERRGAMIRLIVTDTGTGIAPELLPHVFERFRQQKVEPGGRGGLGLGLGIVKHLVELHQGTVVADSQGMDRGATFTVSLPAIQAEHRKTQPRLT
jgi:signal transduction histidine kinase